jgi:HD-GYP domain-containing protein (c-di-GMP phosphodiesterase class II)
MKDKVTCGLLEKDSIAIDKRIRRITDSINQLGEHNKNEYLENMIRSALKNIPEAQNIMLVELQQDQFIPLVAVGYNKKISNLSFAAKDVRHIMQTSICLNAETHQVFIVDLYQYFDYFEPSTINAIRRIDFNEAFGIIFEPITTNGLVRGYLLIINKPYKNYSSQSLKTLRKYAIHLSIYYSQRFLVNNTSDNKFEATTKLLSLAMKKNSEITGHGIRVGYYSGYIAEKLEFNKNLVRDIEIAGALHDIGKFGVPAFILSKPSMLTDKEYSLIKKHPAYTYRILSNIKNLDSISKMTLYHHERFDGTGYPMGLKGEDIPIESQIISIADTFDAMTSDRAYRKALSVSYAIKTLLDEAGKQFKPEIADLAARVLPEIYISYTY